jgi:hypothetical protein
MRQAWGAACKIITVLVVVPLACFLIISGLSSCIVLDIHEIVIGLMVAGAGLALLLFFRRKLAPGLNRLQKAIVVAATILVMIAWLFPPYREPVFDDLHKMTGIRTKWRFDRYMRDTIEPQHYKSADGLWTFVLIEYDAWRELQLLEIGGILSICGAALFVFRKKA